MRSRVGPRPITPSDIIRFFILSSHYSSVFKGFYSITSLFTALAQKKAKFDWLEACEKSIQELKDRLTSALVLTLLESSYGLVVYRDAFRVGLGCALMQKVKGLLVL